MKRTLTLWMVAAVVLVLAGVAGAQSVADVARQTRKQNAKKPAAKVFTNDDLPHNAPISVAGQPPAADDQDKNAGADDQDNAAGNAAPAKNAQTDKTAGEKKSEEDKTTDAQKREKAMAEWRQRFANQKKAIDLLERELDVLQREYRLRAAAYYADAGNALRNQAQWANDGREYQSKIDLKQKQLDEAKQKLENMQEEARRAGMPGSVSE